MFEVDALTVRGLNAVRAGRPCQDTARAAQVGPYSVIAISDGLSTAPDTGEPSGAELGSQILCLAAMQATLQALKSGDSPALLDRAIGVELENVRDLVAHAIGEREALRALPATLVLGVVSDAGVDIWSAGDGEAFIRLLPIEIELVAGRPEPTDHGILWRSQSKRPLVWQDGRTALRRVLGVRGPVAGVYVATDGLAEAPSARECLRAGPATREQLFETLTPSPVTDDDVGIAWARWSLRLQREGLPRRRFSAKEDRQVEHIAESYIARGLDERTAYSRAYGTVQNQRKRWGQLR